MGFAKSGDNSIYKRRAWKKRLEEDREAPCRHEDMRAENGFMVCQSCGFMRLAYAWEDVGKPPDWKPKPRVENGPTDF